MYFGRTHESPRDLAALGGENQFASIAVYT